MKWNVHYGIRLTTDFEVEADDEMEAIDKAANILDNIDVNQMDFAYDDFDIWELKEI